MVKIKGLKSIIKWEKIKDVSGTAKILSIKDPDLTFSSSTFVMLEDAKSEKMDIFKIDKPIESKKEIPKFIFL